MAKVNVDFSKYLEVEMDSVPKNIADLPTGHFFARITGWKTGERQYDKENPQNITPVVELMFSIQAADTDVEEEGNWKGRIVSKDYTLNDPDKAGHTQIRQVAEKACSMPTDGLHLTDVLDSLKNQDVRVYNDPKPPSQEGGRRFPRITKVLPPS